VLAKVGRKVHFLATCMVCLGAHFSAIWIVVANSLDARPRRGFTSVGEGLRARAETTDFWQMSSTLPRWTGSSTRFAARGRRERSLS